MEACGADKVGDRISAGVRHRYTHPRSAGSDLDEWLNTGVGVSAGIMVETWVAYIRSN